VGSIAGPTLVCVEPSGCVDLVGGNSEHGDRRSGARPRTSVFVRGTIEEVIGEPRACFTLIALLFEDPLRYFRDRCTATRELFRPGLIQELDAVEGLAGLCPEGVFHLCGGIA
jgi:hypothetical protein